MDNTKSAQQIDFVAIFQACKKHWKLFPIWIVAAFVIACVIILPVPRHYTCTVKLAPEMASMMGGGSLSSLASQFGIDIGSNALENSDAIMPDLYPDLMSSVDFQTSLFPVPVKTQDGKVNTDYYDYLAFRQKASWWEKCFDWFNGLMMSSKDKSAYAVKSDKVDPFKLSRKQYDICQSIGKKITCSVDKKTSAITITVEDQDPLIAATIADSARQRLQQFITEYRTKKARNDLNYALGLQAKARAEYDKARRDYAAYSDQHQETVLQEYKSKIEDMENEMQLRYNNYTALSTQVQTARAKLVEQTPAFTTLQSASVPVKPSGPKRMIFCGVCMFLAFVLVMVYSMVKENKTRS